jgi:hypothetical protein
LLRRTPSNPPRLNLSHIAIFYSATKLTSTPRPLGRPSREASRLL